MVGSVGWEAGGLGKQARGCGGFQTALLFPRVKQAKLQKHRRLQSLRDSKLMSCMGSEARKKAEMAAEKIHGVRGGGRQAALGVLSSYLRAWG